MDDKRVLVSVRIRPKVENAQNALHQNERYSLEAAAKTSDTSVRLSDGKPGRDSKTHNFTYDICFDKDSTQLDVYEETTLDAVDAVLLGHNATIMTYGQTGSGKTYTVLGAVKRNPLSNDIITAETGLFLRALKDILSFAEQRSREMHVVIGLSVLEIYLDEVRDLLSPEPQPLSVSVIRDTLSIPNMTYKAIRDLNDAVNAYKLANARRVIRATSANDTSSRSHAVFSIEIFQQLKTDANPEPMDPRKLCELREKQQLLMNTSGPDGLPTVSSSVKTPLGASTGGLSVSSLSPVSPAIGTLSAGVSGGGALGSSTPPETPLFASRASNPLLIVPGQPPIMFSKLALTDLAGSEKLKNSNVRGDGLEELKKINASLTALGNVVRNLYEGAKHIPYRDSKLTILLRDCFAAPNSKIVLIATVSPTVLTFDETLSTMFFADKVKRMKVENPQGAEAARLELEYLSTMKTLEELAADLRIAQESLDFRPAALRRFGPSAMVDRQGNIIRRPQQVVAPAAREKELRAVYEHSMEEVRTIQKRRADEERAELDELLQSTRAEVTGAYQATRERVEEQLAAVRRDGLADNSEFEDVVRNYEAETRSATTAAANLEALRASLEPKAAALPQEVAAAKATEVLLAARIEEMERKFFEKNRDVEASWEQHQLVHGKQTAQWEASTNFANACKALWTLKSEYINSRRSSLGLVVDVATAKYESESVDVYQWIRAAVTKLAKNAVVLSLSAQRKAPSTRPAARTTAGGASASSRRVDPNDAANDETAADVAAARAAQKQRKRGSLYDQPTLMGEIVQYVQFGCMVLKYGRSGAPHYRVFYIMNATDDEPMRLCWDEDDDGRRLGKGSWISLESVVRVILGQYTAVFKRIPNAEGFYNSLSLEYISKQQLRTLDLVFDTDAELESWVIALCYFTHKNPRFLDELPNARLLPSFDQLSAAEADVCLKWHIQPELLLTLKRRLIEARVRTKAKLVRITPGELRLMSGVDIFRTCALWERFRADGLVDNPLDKLYSYLDYGEGDEA